VTEPTLHVSRFRVAHIVVRTALAVAGLVAAVFYIQGHAADWDPQYARDIAERTMRFGGSYYENSVHNKGPLEPAMYQLAAVFTSFDTFWFAIAVMVVGLSLLVGFACRRVVLLFDGDPWLAWAAAGIGFVHLALSGADYAGVLYSRNMTVGLLCAAFLLVTGPGLWSGRMRRAGSVLGGAGISLGLAVQTLQPTALSAAVVGGLGLVTTWRIWLVVPRGRWQGRRVAAPLVFVGAASASFLSAPLWYLVSGSWAPFWDGWWVYGRYMSSALGRTFGEQLALGWEQFVLYSVDHIPAHLGAVGFVLAGMMRSKGLTRTQRHVQVALPLWWLAGWLEIVLTQRYSSHYFVVTSVPLMLMCAGFACHLLVLVRTSVRVPKLVGAALAYGLVVLSVLWTGGGSLRTGVSAAVSFRGVDDMVHAREVARDPRERGVQAVLDLVSKPDDPVMTWTNYPWPFLDYRRVSATRFIWKAFLMGEIYLGPTGPEYVLPGSWDLWASDVEATRPVAFLLDPIFPMPHGTPADELLARDFELLFATPKQSIALTHQAADRLRDRSADGEVQFADAAGWKQVGDTIRRQGEGVGAPLELGDMACKRLDATLAFGDTMTFRFADESDPGEYLELELAGGRALARTDDVALYNLEVPRGPSRSLSLLVGTHAAVLMVNGRVAAAMNLLPATTVSVVNAADGMTLQDVGVGRSPAGGEC